MKIVSIFEPCLFTFKFDEDADNEFEILFDLWNDVEYLEVFFNSNIEDLQKGFWGDVTVTDAILRTKLNSGIIEKRFYKLSNEDIRLQVGGLDTIFESLSENIQTQEFLDKRKAKQNRLRIYGLRIEKNHYIITGGAIKLTRTMQERVHTNKELKKLEMCRNYLIETGITDIEGVVGEVKTE